MKILKFGCLGVAGLFALVIIIGVIAAVAGSSKKSGPSVGGTTVAVPTEQPSAASTGSTAPAVTVKRTVTRIVFRVRGDAPDGADITYGSDSDNRSPQGGLGFDGSGEALPFTASLKFHSSALYYDISAQLQGSGNISCQVLAKVTRYWSDGTHISRHKVLAHGHASGGFNICDAQAEN